MKKTSNYKEYSGESLDKLFNSLSNIPNYITAEIYKETTKFKYRNLLPDGSISEFSEK